MNKKMLIILCWLFTVTQFTLGQCDVKINLTGGGILCDNQDSIEVKVSIVSMGETTSLNDDSYIIKYMSDGDITIDSIELTRTTPSKELKLASEKISVLSIQNLSCGSIDSINLENNIKISTSNLNLSVKKKSEEELRLGNNTFIIEGLDNLGFQPDSIHFLISKDITVKDIIRQQPFDTFHYDFIEPGEYAIRLFVFNMSCSLETPSFSFSVKSPNCPDLTFNLPEEACVGENLNLKISNQNQEEDLSNIQWLAQLKGKEEKHKGAGKEITFDLSESGKYYITVDPNRIGCERYIDSINIEPKPKAIITSDSIFCKGDTIKLIGESEGAISFWFDSSFVQITNTTILDANPKSNNGKHHFVVRATDEGQCKDTATINIKVESINKEIGIQGDTTLCANSTLKFSDNSDNEGVTYQWKINGQEIPNTNSANYVVPTDFSKDTTLKVNFLKSKNGCADSSRIVSVEIDAQPIADIKILDENGPVDDSLFCQGESFSLVGITTNGEGQWICPVEILDCNGRDTLVIPSLNIEGIINFKYKVSSSNGYCPDTTIPTNLKGVSNPIQPIIKSSNEQINTICTNGAVEFSIQEPDSNRIYKWLVNGETIGGETGNFFTYQGRDAGKYNISAVQQLPNSLGGCVSSESAPINIDVLVDKAPDTTAVFLLAGDILVSNDSSSCHQWYKRRIGEILDTLIELEGTSNEQVYFFKKDLEEYRPGEFNYYVKTFHKNMDNSCLSIENASCESGLTSKPRRNLYIDLEDRNWQQAYHFEIFPNPNSGQFSFNLEGDGEVFDIAIYDYLGRNIHQQRIIKDITRTNGTIQIPNIDKGIYHLTIINEYRKRQTHRFMVLK